MENQFDTTQTMVDAVMKMNLPNSITKSVKKQNIKHPTVVQSAIFSVLDKKR